MARTIAQIQQSIIDAKNADATLSGLSSTSSVAIWLLWTWVVATVQYILEVNFDNHKAEVQSIIGSQKPHTLQWYATMALAYQYGVALPADTDVYAVVPPADTTVLVVSYAAVVEYGNYLRIKVARLLGGVLAPLTGGELAGLTAYLHQIKDAGVRLQVTSTTADVFQPVVTVYYDPLILNGDGSRIDGTAPTPVKDAIHAFLNSLPFNGLFVYNSFVAALQGVEGVVIASVSAAVAYFTGPPPFEDCMVQYQPDSGYMVLDDAYFAANVVYVAQ
jgi:hypothetical protein